MNHQDRKFIRLVLQLSADHEPDGYPAIQMRDLLHAAAAIKSLSHINELSCQDWAESHSSVEKLYLRHFPMPDDHMGIEDMVDALSKKFDQRKATP